MLLQFITRIRSREGIGNARNRKCDRAPLPRDISTVSFFSLRVFGGGSSSDASKKKQGRKTEEQEEIGLSDRLIKPFWNVNGFSAKELPSHKDPLP